MDNHTVTPWMTYLQLSSLEKLPFGKERRRYIMDAFESNANSYFAVNCEFRPQLKADPDLRKLIKQGKLKAIRATQHSYRNGNFRRTFLVKGDNA